jgi:hypothetical protein
MSNEVFMAREISYNEMLLAEKDGVITALREENERLRVALDKICNGPRDADLDYVDLFVEVKMEARAALEGK